MATSKMSRVASSDADITSPYDFGEPDVLPIDLGKEKILYLKEPSAEDLIEINKLAENKSLGEIEATLQTICILHSPEPGLPRLSMKDAKKFTARQLKKLGEGINQLLGVDEQE